MGVITAEALTAQARAARNPNAPPAVLTPRDRRLPPNPSAAGGNAKQPARMSYYRTVQADPVALGRPKKVRPMSTSTTPSSSQSAAPVKEEEGFSEYSLMSTDPSDWRTSIMTFLPPNKDRKVDIQQFNQPIKMNRKTPKSKIYAEPDAADIKDEPSVPMRGPDGEPVFLPNGEMVMVFADGQTTVSRAKAKAGAASKGKGKASDASAKKKGPSKPKTRQTFKASDETRTRRKEEYLPWLIEDAGEQEWVGKMHDQNDSQIYCIMTIAEGGYFEFTPVHRFYNFMPKSQFTAKIRAEDAEKAYAANGKIDMAAQFAARNGGKVSAATRRTLAKTVKMETEDFKPNVKREQGGDDDDLFGDGGRKRDGDQEGDMDEVEYEDDMADDDEGDRHEEIAEDDDEKDAKERLKREYIAANKAGNDEASDDDDDFEDMLNADGKKLKDVLKKVGDLDDESDEDEDYYGKRYGGAKKEDEDEEMLPVASGVQEQRKIAKIPPPVAVKSATPKSKEPAPNEYPRTSSSTAPKPSSRANSPAGPSGAALVAMRATSSPKRPGMNISRAGSPTGRTASPLAGESFRATSPSTGPNNAAAGVGKKRKHPSADESAAAKKPKPSAPAPAASSVAASVPIPTAAEVIQFIKSHEGGMVPASVLAARFKTKSSDVVKKALVAVIKQIGKIEDGKVFLKPGVG